MQTVDKAMDASVLPLQVPAGHVGPVVLPGTNRHVWWTGRIAIGLRYERRDNLVVGESASWLQTLLLSRVGRRHAAASA